MRRPLPDAFRRRATRPAIIGHRGVRGPRMVENTLAAIEEAKRQGADGVEIDVRLCKTGEVVVFHDPDLARLAKDARAVADVSFEELRRLDVGGERIPTLPEVLELTRSLGLGLNVEIKHDAPDRPRAVAAVSRVLGGWDAAHDVMVSSFDPSILFAHRALVRRCHAQLVHESTYHDWALRIARSSGADGVHTEISLTVPARVRWFTEHAFVNSWTINDPALARAAFAVGVDAVITDCPEGILRSFG